ncbi:MAG: hypothetical protein ACQESG_04885 [Nanobdellota archaeon]
MKHTTKSIIVGRKKRERETDENHPCFVHLFDHNNPHTSGEVPKEMLDFPHTHKVILKGLDINYLLEGNDLVVNDLEDVDITVVEGHVHITGTQVKAD